MRNTFVRVPRAHSSTKSLQRLRPAVEIGTSNTKPPLKTTYCSFYVTIDTLEDDFPSCLALGHWTERASDLQNNYTSRVSSRVALLHTSFGCETSIIWIATFVSPRVPSFSDGKLHPSANISFSLFTLRTFQRPFRTHPILETSGD